MEGLRCCTLSLESVRQYTLGVRGANSRVQLGKGDSARHHSANPGLKRDSGALPKPELETRYV